MRRKIVEAFARSMIEISLYAPHLSVGNRSKVSAFRKEISYQTVPVFIRTSFPGMIRIRSVYSHAYPLLKHFILLPEFSPVVIGVSESFLFRDSTKALLKGFVHCIHAHYIKFCDESISAFSFNTCR